MSNRIFAGVDDCPCFSTFYPIDCKITFFGNKYNIGELTSATSRERMTTNIIFMGTTSID